MRATPLVLALSLLAGCLGGDDPTPAPATAGNATGNSTDVTNLTATDPADLTGGSKEHIHDYWDGATRVTLFAGTVAVEALSEQTFLNVFGRKDPAAGGTRFEFPEGTLVYEGTGQMEITATWAAPTITSLAVALKPPTEVETRKTWMTMNPLTSGTPFVRDVAPAETDMPHESTSRWGFMFAANGPGGVAQGEFDLKIEIVKLRDVTLFPGHPEPLEGSLVLADKDFTYRQGSLPAFLMEALLDQERPVLTPDTPIPMGTNFLILEIVLSQEAATPATQATGLQLFYRGADGVRYQATPMEQQDARYVFGLIVNQSQVDSPYAETSAWRFGPYAQQAVAAAGVDCSFCVDVEVKGHAVITAFADDPTGGKIQPAEEAGGP